MTALTAVVMLLFAVAALAVVWRLEVARLLAEQDRRNVAHMTDLIVIVDRNIRAALEAASRIEEAAAGVAVDLAHAQDRADAATGPEGAAADAASKSYPVAE